MKMTKRILLAALTVASSVFLGNAEAKSQGWGHSPRGANRGYNNYGPSYRSYSYPTYRTNLYANGSYPLQTYDSNPRYTWVYGNDYPRYGYSTYYYNQSPYTNYSNRSSNGVYLNLGNGQFSMYNGFGY